MKRHFIPGLVQSSILGIGVTILVAVGFGAGCLVGAQKTGHVGFKVEGYATIVTPDTITIFDTKKNDIIEIKTRKDYTSLVGIAAPVTAWYTVQNGVNHLEDIQYPTQSGNFLPAYQIRDSIKRIIILPQVEGVDDADGLISAISKYLADNAGWFVAPPALAEEVARRTKARESALDAVNPETGEVDMDRYLEPQRELMSTVAGDTHSDAVLQVRVLKVKAGVHGGVASWDDMTEPVASGKARFLTPWEGVASKGWVYAATADMMLWSQTGRLLWKRRRGFAVLGIQSGFGGNYHQRPLSEVYKDSGEMHHWLVDTLGQLVPPTAPAVTPTKIPQELQEKLDKAKQAGEEQQ